jgi:hypothetical protein
MRLRAKRRLEIEEVFDSFLVHVNSVDALVIARGSILIPQWHIRMGRRDMLASNSR